jgi:hypothetical protein
MRHHHNGSGRRTVLPADWPGSVAAVAEGFMTRATVNLRSASVTTGYDTGTNRTVATPQTPFATSVPARILGLTQVRIPPADAVGAQVRVVDYRVSIPVTQADVRLEPGLLVDVVTCSDPLLVGRTLQVSDVVRGSHLLERDLICTLND